MLVTALLILAGLFVPTARLIEKSGSTPEPGEIIYKVVIYLLPPIALIMAAVLTNKGFFLLAQKKNPAADPSSVSPAVRVSSGRLAIACFILSGLLVLKTLHNLYWLVVWDATDDGLEYFWIVLPVLVSAFLGALLTIHPHQKTVWAGVVFLLLVPGLIIALSYRAQQVDLRQLTDSHAGQVSRLVQAYYSREGQYPQDLQQAKSWYVISLPEPIIIYGQDWCYQAGEDYYQLGYVYREHWSSPELIRQVYSTGGQPPGNEEICAEEIEALILQEPFLHEK